MFLANPEDRHTDRQTRQLYLYNNMIVAMAKGRGLRGWTNGRAWQAQAACGELWARAGEGHGLRRWTDGRAGTRRVGRRASRRSKSNRNRA